MKPAEMFGAAMGRIWASQRIVEDLAALCACGGRFAGTESEVRARQYLAGRMAEATGASVRLGQVPYRGWTRSQHPSSCRVEPASRRSVWCGSVRA
jgi:hypothetical protein